LAARQRRGVTEGVTAAAAPGGISARAGHFPMNPPGIAGIMGQHAGFARGAGALRLVRPAFALTFDALQVGRSEFANVKEAAAP